MRLYSPLRLFLFVAVVSPASAQTTYFVNDPLGSPVLAANESGAVLWREEYTPLGVKLHKQPASTSNRIGYAGVAFDDATGLSQMGARAYDPAIGRFLSMDPAEVDPNNVHSFSRFGYANNNPNRFVDPTGNTPIDIAFLVMDVGSLVNAIASGSGVQSALVNVGLSAVGVVSPVPGTGLALKAARIGDKVVDASSLAAKGSEVGGAATRLAEKGPVHHICTNKNCVSSATGGPWTPRFEPIFEKAGMTLDDALNKVALPGHKGPHPEAYHQAVFRRLTSATDGLNGKAYSDALQKELGAIRSEIQTPGSLLNKLVTMQ